MALRIEAEITPAMAQPSRPPLCAAVRRGSIYEGLRETITAFAEVIDEVRRL